MRNMLNLDNSIDNPDRIKVLDALRGYALIGIFILHFSNSYSLFIEINPTSFDSYLKSIITIFFSNRFSSMFSILFGVSTFIILKGYDAKGINHIRFVWRCCLLILIGLLLKYIYTWEILMLYGIFGIFLIPFYRIGAKKLLYLSIILYLISPFLGWLKIGDIIFPNSDIFLRNNPKISFVDYFSDIQIKGYFRTMIDSGSIDKFSLFIWGLYLGKSGIIYNMRMYFQKYRVLKFASLLSFLLLVLLFLCKLFPHIYKVNDSHIIVDYIFMYINHCFIISSMLILVTLFVYLYTKFSFFQIFESYGKLGLSHYILQSIIGIWFIYGWGLELYRYSLTYRLIICFSLCIIGLYLSKIYLKILKYGPFEWTWRCFTSFHIFSILVNKK